MQFSASVEITLSEAVAQCCIVDIAPTGFADARASDPRIMGEIEYWAAGDNYRINSYVDPAKYPGMDTQVAYNGERFQLLRLSASTLSYSVRDSASLLPILPNPLLELLQFRYPVTDENSPYRLRLKDIVKDKIPDAFWNVEWVSVKEKHRILERAEFPGGTYEGQEYVHAVYAVPGSRNKPVRIDRVTARGPVTSAEFSHYFRVDTADGPSFWPRRVVLKAFDVEGEQVGKISFIITSFSLGAKIPPETFTISLEAAERVWDDDRAEFVVSSPAQ
jgi:hypothetical protein